MRAGYSSCRSLHQVYCNIQSLLHQLPKWLYTLSQPYRHIATLHLHNNRPELPGLQLNCQCLPNMLIRYSPFRQILYHAYVRS